MPLLDYQIYPTTSCQHCDATLDPLERCSCPETERRVQKDLELIRQARERGAAAHVINDPVERAAAIKRILARTD